MDMHEFFKQYHKTVYPVFVTKRTVRVKTYVWHLCQDPHAEERVFTIPKGTEIKVCGYSNFGDGYSMMPVKPRRVFKGKNLSLRWFRCAYSNMEYLEHRWSKN